METQPRSLNTLYKLLWEQIKDKPRIYSLNREINLLFLGDDITKEEYWYFDKIVIESFKDSFLYSNTTNRKEFVKRMIKETENLK